VSAKDAPRHASGDGGAGGAGALAAAPALAPPPGASARGLTLAEQRTRFAWLFLAPMAIVLLLVAGWPLARTIFFSLTQANINDMANWEFSWFLNYQYLFRDAGWWQSVWNTLLFTVVSVSLETMLGLVIALTLNAHMPGRGLLRAAVLIPWAIPTVVSAKMWSWMLNDQYGVVNAVLLDLGALDTRWAWLADPTLSMVSVIAVDVWKATPFMALLILAALQVLPGEVYEAARVDGVHPVKVFFRITLPLIRPALLVAVIFRGLDAMRVFDVIYVLTGNNPNTASMSVFARRWLVENGDVGYGSTAATCLFLVVAMVTVLVITVGKLNVAASGGER
jgi:trehalose/maltose transport system permease protein